MSDNFNCYLCNNDEFSIVADQDQIRFDCYGFKKTVAKCSKCSLVQLYPPWKDSELNEMYAHYSQKEDFPGHKRKEIRSYYLEKLIRKTDYTLEVGCGLGHNLRRLRKKSYNAIGIDKDPAVCDGRAILNYDFKDFYSKEKFDFIYAIHVFEHISEPYRFIEWIQKNLAEKGTFLLEMPSIDDPLLKIYNNRNFNKFYWYPYHLYFYNKRILKIMFERFPNIKARIILLQRYGLINHMRWLVLGRPGNVNNDIPLIDIIYKFILTRLFGAGDTVIVVGERR